MRVRLRCVVSVLLIICIVVGLGCYLMFGRTNKEKVVSQRVCPICIVFLCICFVFFWRIKNLYMGRYIYIYIYIYIYTFK